VNHGSGTGSDEISVTAASSRASRSACRAGSDSWAKRTINSSLTSYAVLSSPAPSRTTEAIS
jgi:hypothetical protein